jgi:predicted DNA-binding protein (MmcQ/YjbR family)
MKQPELESHLSKFDNIERDESSQTGLVLYKVTRGSDGKIFAIIVDGSVPLRIELRCDAQLARKLRDEYETVLHSQYMNKDQWNSIILTGQIPQEELEGFIDLSYQLSLSELQNN